MTNTDGVVCSFCGALMVRTGACYTCPSCGESTGCGFNAHPSTPLGPRAKGDPGVSPQRQSAAPVS